MDLLKVIMDRPFEILFDTNKKCDVQAFYLLEMFIYENQKLVELFFSLNTP